MDAFPDPLHLLSTGVPLTLLIDLVDTAGLDSEQVYRDEGGAADWLWGPREAPAA